MDAPPPIIDVLNLDSDLADAETLRHASDQGVDLAVDALASADQAYQAAFSALDASHPAAATDIRLGAETLLAPSVGALRQAFGARSAADAVLRDALNAVRIAVDQARTILDAKRVELN